MMKKIMRSLLVIFHIGLLATFILNQFGIGPAWIGTALAAHPQAETEDEEWDRQRPPGMRDADWEQTTGFVEATREPGAIDLAEWERLLAFLEERPEDVDEADWDMIRLYFYDRGPAEINVEDYPEDMRKRYEVFLDRCSQCHGIARAVNAPFVLPEEWRRYIRLMQRKPGSGISPRAARDIFEFMTYDSQTRRRALYERRMREKDAEANE